MKRSVSIYWLVIGWLLCLPAIAKGGLITGKITDEHAQPLPFVSVYLEGTTQGTTSNIEGDYKLELAPGTYRLVYRMIGYRQQVEEIRLGQETVRRDIRLLPESYKLKEVTINAAAEDPAYAIIRQAQAKRSYYQDEVKAFRCESYVKSTQRLTSYPKRFFGQPVDIGPLVDSASGIMYLSESVSKIAYRQPGGVKEEMLSSIVSGDPRAYSFNRGADLQRINFYSALLDFGGLVPRGIVSPIAPSAMLFYRFKLEGTFVENGQLINKISVIPRRPNDPVFTGDIFIVENSWRIHSADLYITRAQQMEFVDTFRVRQNYLPVGQDLWMPFNNTINFSFSFLGFVGRGQILGIFSNYQLQPEFAEKEFNNEVLKVNADANKKDSVYWAETRPVPLTDDERHDYVRRDSVRQVVESKPYLDSIDRKNNKFKFNSILTSYNHSNSWKHRFWSIHSPIETISFNTVEGWNGTLRATISKEKSRDDAREWKLEGNLRYGLSNTHWNPSIHFYNLYNTKSQSSIHVYGGSEVLQFNRSNPITPLTNALYSLYARKNYMKIFQQQYLRLEHRSEITNGFAAGIFLEYAHREPLRNTTDYAFKLAGKERKYTSNDPLHPASDESAFPANDLLEVTLRTRFIFGQEYITRPEGKYIIGSDLPILRLQYRKAVPLDDLSPDFDEWRASLEDDMRFGLLGRFEYLVAAGDFLNSKRLYLMDARHFNGNKTWFSPFRISDFMNLEYYAFSTTGFYVEGHAEHHFGGFLLNKIPLIRKLKLNEVASFHYLHNDLVDQYVELGLGVEKLNLFRFQVYTSIAEGKRGNFGVVVGIRKPIR